MTEGTSNLLPDETANDEVEPSTAKTLLLEGTELVETWLELFELDAGDPARDVLDVLLLVSVADANTTADEGFAELLLLMALLVNMAEVIACVV